MFATIDLLEAKRNLATVIEATATAGANDNRVEKDAAIKQLRAFLQAYGDRLILASGQGLLLSRIAACSERRNQPQFLEKLFDQCAVVQSQVDDGKPHLKREIPDFETELEK